MENLERIHTDMERTFILHTERPQTDSGFETSAKQHATLLPVLGIVNYTVD